jgi:serine/threonine-protein kinase
MATVHFGRLLGAAGFSRTVAIKRLHPQFARDPEFVAMLVDEARIAARIRHPHVVPTLDVVAAEGELFLVMDYVPGESLARLRRAAPAGLIPLRVASAIFCGALHGLHAAHEATDEQGQPLGIVHRDMSPQNILVGEDGVARVLDFGVALAAGRSQLTGDGKIKGKLGYFAPEQLGGQVTRQSDLFAVAVALWEALTGRRLFVGDDPGRVIAKILHGEIVAPTQIAPDLPKRVDEVVMRGLERDPLRRYATAHEMATDLENCLELASTRQVSEWVDSVAHAPLSHRRAVLAAIESSSAQLPSAAPSDAEPARPPAVSIVSENVPKPPYPRESISGVGWQRAAPDARTTNYSIRRGRATWARRAAAAGVLLLAGALAAVILERPQRRGADAGATAATQVAPSGTPRPLGAIRPPATEISSGEPAPAPVAVNPSAVAAPATASATLEHEPATFKRPAPSTQGKATPPGSPNCALPFVLDAQGHKIWKEECF